MSLVGKVAIVTGAGHGIGEATAKLLAERGASVVCVDMAESCDRVANEIVARGGKAMPFRANITDRQAVKAMVDRTVAAYDKLDILVNNAGWWDIPRHTPIENVKEEDFRKVIEINLFGHFNCVQAAVPYMRKQRYGKIVNLGSGAGIAWSRTGIHAYATAKAGLMGLTRQLAKELAPLNINVNCVAPGLVDTSGREVKPEEMTPEQRAASEEELKSVPAGRIGKPMDIATVIAFMVSDDAWYIHGQVLSVDGGHWMK